MKTIISALFGITVASAASSGKYFTSSNHVNFENANRACAAAGGKLATFHSDANYNIAKGVCENQCNTANPGNGDCGCWIGLKDDLQEGVWRWTDASAKDYAMTSSGAATTGVYPWHAGEPNNAGGNEDCTHIWKPQGYDINDISCGDGGNYAMCEELTADEMKVYFTIDTKTTFANGEALCQAQNGYLASFHSDAEYYLAQSKCITTCENSGSPGGCGCFVGFTDSAAEGKWVYTDGSAADYGVDSSGVATRGIFPWHYGEPNNVGSSGEDCAHIWQSQGYELNDIPCTTSYYPLCLDTGITDSPTPAPTCETEKPKKPQLSITLASAGVTVFEDGLYARVLNMTSVRKKRGKGRITTYEWSDWKPLTEECGALTADLTDYFDDFSEIDDEWIAVALYNCGSAQFSIDSVGIWNGRKLKTIDYFCSGIAGPSRSCGASATTGEIGVCNSGFAEYPYDTIIIDDATCSAVSFNTYEQSTGKSNIATPFSLSDPGIPQCVAMGYAYENVFMDELMMDAESGEQDMTVTYASAAAVFVAGAAMYACYRHKQNKDSRYKLIQ